MRRHAFRCQNAACQGGMRQISWPDHRDRQRSTQQRNEQTQYTNIPELAPELPQLLIEKTVVHEKAVKWHKHALQAVEIYYNGIGSRTNQGAELLQLQDTKIPRQAS